MMTFSYYPNKNNLLAIPLLVLCAIFATMAAIQFAVTRTHSPEIVMLICVVIFCGVSIRFIYQASKQAICGTDKEIIIINGSGDLPIHIAWTEISCGYETTNFKGQVYLVLSKKHLTTQQVKRIVNKCSWSLRICMDEVYVIWDNSSNIAKQCVNSVKHHVKVEIIG